MSDLAEGEDDRAVGATSRVPGALLATWIAQSPNDWRLIASGHVADQVSRDGADMYRTGTNNILIGTQSPCTSR